MAEKSKIVCLPVAGIENPYQYLMIKGLNSTRSIEAFNGVDDRFLGIIKTILKYKPNYLHFDWIQSYYIRKKFWLSLILLPLFIFQVLYIDYFTKSKIVWTLHNIFPHNSNNVSFNRWVRHFFAKHCEWIRVFSEDSIERASNELTISNKKFIVVPEGDYTDVYPNVVSQDRARKELEIDENDLVFLSLGFIKRYKGIKNLIVEFSKLKNKNLQLIIAGQIIDKTYYDEVHNTIVKLQDKRIHLKGGFIPNDKLQFYYNAADIVVLPFEKIENSGSAIMAMGFKKPIIAPKIGVLKKRLNQQYKLLYTNLTEGLETVIKYDKKELIKIGKANFQSLKEYKWEDFIEVFL